MPTPSTEQQWNILRAFVPPAAESHLREVLTSTPVSIGIHRRRTSKWGDYRIRPDRPPMITVNGDLAPPFFLLTLLHEIAHHKVHLIYGHRKVAPHGAEWKAAFQALMRAPLASDEVFGSRLSAILRRHMLNPRANVSTDPALLGAYLEICGEQGTPVDALASGQVFLFRTKQYRVRSKVRKRIACECLLTKRTFLFQPGTPVEVTH